MAGNYSERDPLQRLIARRRTWESANRSAKNWATYQKIAHDVAQEELLRRGISGSHALIDPPADIIATWAKQQGDRVLSGLLFVSTSQQRVPEVKFAWNWEPDAEEPRIVVSQVPLSKLTVTENPDIIVPEVTFDVPPITLLELQNPNGFQSGYMRFARFDDPNGYITGNRLKAVTLSVPLGADLHGVPFQQS